MAFLFSLSDVPAIARQAERAARQRATETSGYEIVLRPGWHGEPADSPPVCGYVESLEAAQAFARATHKQPCLGKCRMYAYRPFTEHGPGIFPKDAPGRDNLLRDDINASDPFDSTICY
jgi:hypothetical protein